MKITYIAQSGVIVELQNGIRFCIDLWLDNPINKLEINDIPKMDYVFITHDHPDHDMKTGIELAKRDNAVFIASTEISELANSQGVKKTDEGYCGGTVKVGELEITRTLAHHASDTGIPIGFIIKTSEGVIYHMGDTAYFSELKTYGDWYDIDILMVPIGSRYTMDSFQASHAVSDVKPKIAIPIHYNTFPAIQQSSEDFVRYVGARKINTEVIVMKPGETRSLL